MQAWSAQNIFGEADSESSDTSSRNMSIQTQLHFQIIKIYSNMDPAALFAHERAEKFLFSK